MNNTLRKKAEARKRQSAAPRRRRDECAPTVLSEADAYLIAGILTDNSGPNDALLRAARVSAEFATGRRTLA